MHGPLLRRLVIPRGEDQQRMARDQELQSVTADTANTSAYLRLFLRHAHFTRMKHQ